MSRGYEAISATVRRMLPLGTLPAALILLAGVPAWGQPENPFVDDTPEDPTLPERVVVAEPEGPLPVAEDFQPPAFLQPIRFGSPPAEGYRAESATTGTRFDTPLIDFPGTIEVVPEQVLFDQQVLSMDDVLRNVGGKAVDAGNALRPDAFFLNGFEVRSRDYRKNGFLDPTTAPRDFANVQQIEVLVGSASALYGGGQPTGVVNLITKRPLATRHNQFDFQYGSFDLRRVTLDSTGPLVGAGGNLLYRINFAYTDSNSFRDFGFNHRSFVAPAVTWILSDRTRVTWEGEYLWDRRRYDTGVAALGGRVDALPIDRFLGEPQDYLHYQDYRSTLFIDHEISDCWSLRFGAYSHAGNNNFSGTVPLSTVPMTPFVIRQRRDVDEFQEQYHSIIFDVAGEFWTGNARHELLLGTEQGWLLATDFTAFQSDPGFLPSPPFPAGEPLMINALAPVYGTPVMNTPIVFDSDFTQNRHGVYLSDVVELTRHLKGLVGVRYDRVHQKFDRSLTPFPAVRDDQDFERWSPRAGLVFQPVPELLSTYVSYSEAFDMPPGGGRIEPNPIEPELGRTWEGGIKAELLSGLTLTASGFYTEKDNEVFDDSDLLTLLPIVAQLDVRSQVAELSLVGQLTDHWSVVANYAYIDARIVGDSRRPDRIGNRVRNVPYNNGNVWLRYDRPLRDCESIGAAFGMVHRGERPGDLENTFVLPSYTRWDAGLYYNCGALRVAVYFENLFDDRYYTGSENPLIVFPGAPFNARGTIGLVY